MITMTAQLAGNVPAKQMAAIKKEWKKALTQERNTIYREYKATTETWKEHHPRFKSKEGESQTAMWVDVWTENRIYWFVHESIDVLRAVFSNDWHPKTQPGRLVSRSGRGKMVYASKAISLPPYEAREFTELIIKREKKSFQKLMEEATRKGAQAASRGG